MKRLAMMAMVGLLSACGSMSDSTMAESSGGGTANAGEPSGGMAGSSPGTPGAPGEGTATDPGTGVGEPSKQNPAPAGQLTAGAWDDNANFDLFKKYVSDNEQRLGGVPTFSPARREAARDAALAQSGAKSELDIAFVLDTTGSMGDELAYIQAEIGNIASGIKLAYPQLVPRFGLVSYRDDGDVYVARSTDFTADLGAFRQALNAESAGGGGDIPEAADDGLHAATALSWRSGAVARVAFWVADAPHHTQDTASMTTAIESAMQKGVHVYPIGASGVEERAEFTMRTAAQMSGGRYLFLTDDSGIGNSHAEPHIPCYYVTTLKDAVARMMRVELAGEHVRPGEAEILRSVGAPKDGICTLRDGQTTAKAF